jgi:hypothetical protein
MDAVFLGDADPVVGVAGAAGRGGVGVVDREITREVANGEATHEGAEVDAAGRERERAAVGEIGEGDVEVQHGRAETEDGIGRGVEGEVDAVIAGGVEHRTLFLRGA